MPTCQYCDEILDDEDEYLRHLCADRYGELGRIDQRRVDDRFETGTLGRRWLKMSGGAVVALALIAVSTSFMLGGGGPGAMSGSPPAQLEIATSGTLSQQGTMLSLQMTCYQCGEYCKGCPRCDDTLARATNAIDGVYGAQFAANQSTTSAIRISFDPKRVSAETIMQIIKQTNPYPGCCKGLSVVSTG